MAKLEGAEDAEMKKLTEADEEQAQIAREIQVYHSTRNAREIAFKA